MNVLNSTHQGFVACCCCSKSEKGDKELMVKEALANTKIWEARCVINMFKSEDVSSMNPLFALPYFRYQAVEKSRHEYRENAKRLVTENEALQNAVNQVMLTSIIIILQSSTMRIYRTRITRAYKARTHSQYFQNYRTCT